MADDDLSVKFGGETSGLKTAAQESKDQIASIADSIEGLKGGFLGLAEGIAAAFSAEKITQFVEGMANLAVQTQKTASLLGISTSAVSGLDIAARAGGESLETVTHSLERLGLGLQRGQAGSQQAMSALHALGLEAKNLIGQPLPEVLGTLADKFSVLKDGIDKDAIAMALLGRGGAALIPVLNEGRHGLEEFNAMAERAGSAMGPETVAGFEKTHLALIELGKSFQGLGITIMNLFKPAIDGLIKVLIDMVQGFNNSLKAAGVMQTTFGILAEMVKTTVVAFAILVAAVEATWETIKVTFALIGSAAVGLGKIIYAALKGDLAGVKTAWAEMTTAIQGDVSNFSKNYTEIVKRTVDEVNVVWKKGADEQVKIEQTKAAQLNLTNRDAVSGAMKSIEGQIKVLQQGLEQKKIIFEAEAKQFQITQNQKFASLQAATEAEYRAELALLQREAQIGGMSVTQKQDVNNKIRLLEAKHQTDMIKLDEQSIAEQQKLYTNFFNSIQGAFNSQLRGLLAGTVSWSQAFKNILGDLLIKFIEMIEKMVFEWAAGQLAQTTATQSGAAARATSEVAGQTATLPARVAKFTSDILADSAAVFAGIFANMAPLLGPAAVGPAGAGQATVLAQLANVPKFDVGTPYVMKTGLAVVHEGEKITPAQGSGPYQGGGGSVQPIFQIHAIDAAGVQAFFSRNAGQIARVLTKHMNQNPSFQT